MIVVASAAFGGFGEFVVSGVKGRRNTLQQQAIDREPTEKVAELPLQPNLFVISTRKWRHSRTGPLITTQRSATPTHHYTTPYHYHHSWLLLLLRACWR